MSNQQFNKEQLQKEVNQKARASVKGDAGLDELIRFTLDNFAYRYLESKNSKDLKSYATGTHSWHVEGKETELIEALKAQNPETKRELIAKAKAHAKKDGAAVYPWLEIQVSDQKAKCIAGIDWESDNERQTIAKREERMDFEDVLELRNRLAKVLENACEVF